MYNNLYFNDKKYIFFNLGVASILEVQETTDKEEIGSQIELEADSGTFNYKVDKEYNIVLKSVK